jgi:hypothetical protein
MPYVVQAALIVLAIVVLSVGIAFVVVRKR